MKQQSLQFATRRSTAAANAKGTESKSPSIVPSTPAPAAAPQADASGSAVPEEEKTPSSSVWRKGRSTEAQVAEEDRAAAKKRKRTDAAPLVTSKSNGKRGSAKRKRIFKSRVSLENTEDVQASRRQEESSEDEGLAELDMSEHGKQRRLLKQFREARAKMDHLAASTFLIAVCAIP